MTIANANKKFVEIFNGQFRNEQFDGTFEVVTNFRKHTYADGPKSGKIEIIDDQGKKMAIWVNEDDFRFLTKEDVSVAPTVIDMPIEELEALINERFDTMERIANGVVSGHISSLIISGSPGVGKTHKLSQIFDQAQKNKQIDDYCFFSGSASALGLYKELYNYSGKNDIIVLDDIDKLLYDLEAVSVLKSALDSSKVRRVSWLKDSRVLREEDIPNSFDFQGKVVYITNEDFYSRISKRDKLAPHLEAFLSRSSYLDLAIHSIPAILIRIKQVVFNSNMLDDYDITEQQKHEIVDWLDENKQDLFRVDLRTVIKIASFMAMDYSNWKSTAKSCLCKPSRR